MKIRALEREDDRSSFSSGDDDLDRFFRRFAGQNQFKHHLAATYVAVDGDVIVGYATVTAGHIKGDVLPLALARRLPDYPLPILRLGRLAVSKKSQGTGIGGELLAFVLDLALKMAESVGCIGVTVDAKASAIDFYRRFGFVPVEGLIRGHDQSRPEPAPMFLPLDDIERAGR